MTIKEYIDSNFSTILDDIISIIKIKSVKSDATVIAPFGEDIKRCLDSTLDLAKRLGFRVKNLDNYIGYAEIGEGDEYIAILGHLDVVPEGDISKWTVHPYSGSIINNCLVSRGAIDNKSPIISSLHSIKALLAQYPNFNKRVRIIFGTNEESGDEDIKYYLEREKAPKYAFTPDGRFPVIFSEKGIYTFSFSSKINLESSCILKIESGSRSNVVPELAKVFLKKSLLDKVQSAISSVKSDCTFNMSEFDDYLCVDINGKSAHASSPHKGINALLGMYIFLDMVLDDNDSCKKFVSFISKNISDTTDGKLLGIDAQNEEVGDLTISAGITHIVNDDEIFVKFNVRYPISITESFLDETLNNKANENGVLFKKENHNPPLYFPKDSILVRTLQNVYKDVTNREEEPASLGGGTYAKLMPNTVAFGPNYKEFNGNAHSFDECIDLDILKVGIEIYAKSILNLSEYI